MTTLFKDEILAQASEAINLPEVQELVRQLSRHHLGVFVPHMHGPDGDFQQMPAGFVAVESDLVTTFRSRESVVSGSEAVIPVGWTWEHDSGVVAAAYCVYAANTSTGKLEHVTRYY